MGVMVYSLLWVMQDLYHQPYLQRPLSPVARLMKRAARPLSRACGSVEGKKESTIVYYTIIYMYIYIYIVFYYTIHIHICIYTQMLLCYMIFLRTLVSFFSTPG